MAASSNHPATGAEVKTGGAIRRERVNAPSGTPWSMSAPYTPSVNMWGSSPIRRASG
jgi:hypothetical protein